MKISKLNASAIVLAALLSLSAASVNGQEAAPKAPPAPPEPLRNLLPIVEVVVYEDRALVTREGEVTVQGGKVETVLVGGLPPALSETSIRAGLGDAASGKVISVSSDVERKREIQDTRLRAAEEERRKAARAIVEIDDDLARLAQREAYLDAYEKLAQRGISERTGGGDPQTARWSEALKFIRDGRAALLASRRDAGVRKEALARTQGDLDAEAQRLRRPAERSERRAEISLEMKSAGKARLRLSYVIPGAAWIPRYDARFDPEKSELAVTYFGEIQQRTGEDWKDARLVLSTARPSVGASRPEILPVRLTAEKVDGGAKGKGIADHLETGGQDLGFAPRGLVAASAAPPAPDEGLVPSATRENATSAVFTVPGTATIPSDARPHKVPVATFRDRAETHFETVPSLARFVYLKAVATNTSPYPMLAGAVDIYRGSGFIGTAALKFVPPGRNFEVSLGIEESLKVKRVVAVAAWDSKRKEKRQGFDIEVANFGEKPQTVLVIENHPVSDLEEVRVHLDAVTPQPTSREEKDGMLRWKLEVPSGEARQTHLEYTVTYPKDYQGVGG